MKLFMLMALAVNLTQCDTYKHRIDVFMSPQSLTLDPTFWTEDQVVYSNHYPLIAPIALPAPLLF